VVRSLANQEVLKRCVFAGFLGVPLVDDSVRLLHDVCEWRIVCLTDDVCGLVDEAAHDTFALVAGGTDQVSTDISDVTRSRLVTQLVTQFNGWSQINHALTCTSTARTELDFNGLVARHHPSKGL